MSRPRNESAVRPILPLDLAFLIGETHAAPLHVGALVVFEPPPADAGWTPADLVAAYRSTRPAAPFDRVPEFPLIGAPRWRTVADVDMQYHVRHLRVPAPGGDRQLHDLVQELHSAPLDRGQPLFRVFVLEGLADGGLAIYTQAHHALVDGVSGLMRVVAGLRATPRAGAGLPFFASLPRPGKAKAKAEPGERWSRAAEAIVERTFAAGEVSLAAARKLVAALEGTPEANTPFLAPVTPINRQVRNGRAIASLSLPLADLRAIGHRGGGTINDAVLAIVDVAVGRYLEERHAAVRRPLVALVPVSLREKGDVSATTKATVVACPLADPGTPARKRVARIAERLDAVKAEIRAMPKSAAAAQAVAAALLAAGLDALGIERPAVNFIVSNVPGPERDLFLGGARVRGIFPLSGVGARIGLNVTLFSQGGEMHVSFCADRHQLPDPERVAALCREAFDALAAKPRPRPVAATRAKHPVRKGASTSKRPARRRGQGA